MQHIRGFFGVGALHKITFYLLTYLQGHPTMQRLKIKDEVMNSFCFFLADLRSQF